MYIHGYTRRPVPILNNHMYIYIYMHHEPSKVEVLGSSSLDVSISETATPVIPGCSPCVALSKTW